MVAQDLVVLVEILSYVVGQLEQVLLQELMVLFNSEVLLLVLLSLMLSILRLD